MREPERYFKDWVMPGPMAPGHFPNNSENIELAADESLDSISGTWKIFQYTKGHRYSTDDLLTSWYGTIKCPSAARVLDLGSGIGSVGMMTAWRLPGAKCVTIEAQAISVALAKKSVQYNGIEDRYEIIEGDLRNASLLKNHQPFDLVLGSPPYFPLGTGVEGQHPQTIPCRFEVRGDIADYAQTAALQLAPGGVFACVFPTLQIDRVTDAAQKAGLCIFSRRDVVFREGDAPLISLFAMALQSDLPPSFASQTWIELPLTIRLANGDVHPEYRAVKFTMGFRP